MNRKPMDASNLEALLLALEDDVLKLEDGAILSEDCDSLSSIRQLRALVQTQIEDHVTRNCSEPSPLTEKAPPPESSAPRATPFAVPDRPSGRRLFLERLVSTETNLPHQVRMAFSGGHTPSDSQIESLIEQLVRIGICKPSNDRNS